MHSWECIEKATTYIEKNLDKKMTVDELANMVNLSPFYFQRLFKRLVDITLMEYIKVRRLAKISEELRINKNEKIIDIYFKYGFENQETFCRSFKEAYGMTPTQYRAKPVLLSHFLKPSIFLQYNIVDEDVPVVTDGIVLEVTRYVLENPKYFIGHLVEVPYETIGIDPLAETWETIHKTKSFFENYKPDGNEIGVNINIGGQKNQKYFAGVETSKETQSEQLDNYTLATGKYIICKFEAEDFYTLITETIKKVYTYMHLWIENKKVTVEPTAIELYYGSTKEISYMELWIPLLDE